MTHPTTVLIVAGTYRQYLQYIQQHEPPNPIYVSKIDDMLNHSGTVIVRLVGTYYERTDIAKILEASHRYDAKQDSP